MANNVDEYPGWNQFFGKPGSEQRAQVVKNYDPELDTAYLDELDREFEASGNKIGQMESDKQEFLAEAIMGGESQGDALAQWDRVSAPLGTLAPKEDFDYGDDLQGAGIEEYAPNPPVEEPREPTLRETIIGDKALPDYIQGLDPRGKLSPRRANDWKAKLDAMWSSTTMLGNITKYSDYVWAQARQGESVADDQLYSILLEGYGGTTGGLSDQYEYKDDNGMMRKETSVDGMFAEILDVKARYGDAAALVRAKQMREDVLNGKMIQDLSWNAALGYGAVSMMADPLFWLTGGAATATVKVGTSLAVKAGRTIANKATSRDVLTQSIRMHPRTAGSIARGTTAETMARWSAISGIESTVTNTARLFGDVTYTVRDLKNDVMMETAFGGILGFAGGAWKANSTRMANRIDAKKADIQREVNAQQREIDGDMSNFEVADWAVTTVAPVPTNIRSNIAKAYKDQLLVSDNMLKMNPNTLRVPYNALVVNAGGPQASKIVALNDMLMDTHAARLSNADNTQKWLSEAALDAVTQLNGRWLHTRSMLDETRKVTEGQELLDVGLSSSLNRAWQDVNREIGLLTKDFGSKVGATPEAIADNIQAMMYLNDKLGVLARDAEQDIMTTSQRQKYDERGQFTQTPLENEEQALVKMVLPDVDFDNIDLGIALRSPVELPNSRSIELSDLPLALRKVHADRKNGVSKLIKQIVRPNTTVWANPPLSLRDVDGLTLKQLDASIATIKNNPMVETTAFKQSGILSKLYVMKRVMKGNDKQASEVAGKLALDYTVLASYYAKNLPMHVASKLKKTHFAKRKVYLNGALDDMLNGSVVHRTSLISKYVKYMKNSESMTALGDDIRPLSYDELLNKNLDVMRADSVQGWSSRMDEWDEGIDRDAFSTVESPLESTMGIIKQVNEDAMASADPDFLKAVAELNGVVDKRLLDMELGVLKDPAQPYITRELSESETRIHMAENGWNRSDAGYKKEFNRVRKTGVEMTTDMRNALKTVLQDTEVTELLPQNIAMYNKENLLEVVNEATLKELRTRLHKNVMGPLEIYGNKSHDYRRLKKISERKDQLVANATGTITNMINRGDVAMLNDTIAAAATVRADKMRIITDNERKISANKERQQHIANASKDAEMANPEMIHMTALHIKDQLKKVRDAKAKLDNALRNNPNGNTNALNKGVVEANSKLAYLMREMEDNVGMNSTALAGLKRQETEMLAEIHLAREALPESGSANSLDAGNLDTIANDVGTGSPELEVPDKVIEAAAPVIADKAHNKVMQGLGDFVENELELAKLNAQPRSTGGWVGYHIGRGLGLTQDLATTFQKSESTVMQFIGHKITEMGRGHAGANQRVATGGVIREAEYVASVMQMIPGYTKAIDAYAVTKGSGAIGRLNAATQNGASDATVNAFNREFFLAMNAKRLGKPADELTAEMNEFINDWNKYMDYNHGRLVDEGIQGFTAERKISNYIPQIWNSQKIKEAWAKDPYAVTKVFLKGYRNAGHDNAEELAERQLKYLLGMTDSFDQHMPNMEGRAKHQIKIDQSAEVDGVGVLDFMDTEVAKLGMVYSNRVAGHIGMAKSTDGMLTGLQDIKALKAVLQEEVGVGHQSLKDFDDLIDLMYGRPTQGGLPEWARDFKDLAVLTRMGGLGTAQAIETGTVATRGLLEASADPQFLRKLTEGLSPEDTAVDLMELQKMSGYNWDFEWLNRQSVHLDTEITDNMSQLKARGNQLADFATFGKLKAPASRMLGKVTGFNAIRKFQSAAMQRSFGFAVARHFKSGNSKMSVGRMADLGLTDPDGINVAMKSNIDEHVVFDADGYPTKYNFDKWDKDVRETFHYAMQRADAQDIQRGLVGESMRWMNKPLMQMISQFRGMPLIAQNKQLARSMAFADREAVTQLALNTMMAGLVRSAKVATIATGAAVVTGSTVGDEFETRWRNAKNDAQLPGAMDKYITQAGMLADVTSLGVIAGDTWQRVATAKTGYEGAGEALEALLGQVPALSTMNSGLQTGIAMGKGNPAEAVKEVQGYAPLGTTLMMEWLFTGVEANMRK